MEHRWGSRILVDLPVRISGQGVTGTGTLRNLSVSGGFIETALPLAVLTMVRVQIPRGLDGGLPAADTWGFVVRHERHGIGMEWCDLAPLPLQVRALSWHSVSRQRSVAPVARNDFLILPGSAAGTIGAARAPTYRAPLSATRFPP